jgi:hypothetical protein
VGKWWNAYRVLMGHLTEIDSLEVLNADENIVRKECLNGMAWTTSVWLEIRVTVFVMYGKLIH